ncbi:type II toxin-antitoxin system VapC family toxin [Burkholderiaceae bacterium DAT-1]|nr:type II toxin-antitoxin system VapC family toxin [Burkholderiaceae bacterium DAT-1]
MFLIDTNVISEARKGARANLGVQQFFAEADPDELFLPVQVVGEIRRGAERIRRRGDELQAAALDRWLSALTGEYSHRIISFDTECAQVWGMLTAGGTQHAIDMQIAAVALIYDLTLVTRNEADFAGTGVKVCNPFVE